MCLRLRLIALALSALTLGGVSRGHAQTSTGPGSATAAPAPACSADTGQSPQSAQDILNTLAQQDLASAGAYATTAAYVAQFYPLWFTYYQAQTLTGGPRPNANQLVSPQEVTPLYNVVVAINVDTVYASAFLDLTAGPLILTIPSTVVKYSILTLDPYGDIFPVLQPQAPGAPGVVYALTGPGFSGTLPPGVIPVAMPLNAMNLIFRADKFSPAPDSVDQTDQANTFRNQLQLQTLSDYLSNPSGGATKLLPESNFAFPFKLTADELIARTPILFLRTLQLAVASPRTPPLSPFEQALSSRFDALFGNGVAQRAEFGAGAQLAHALIVNRYLTHTVPTNWVHFNNIGCWDGGTQVIDRSAITEFCQYCNDISAAAYYHAFKDVAGRPLDGSNPNGYVLTFRKDQLPQATRFWSLTAYTPETIELIPNPAQKYVVAGYTPGLQSNPDGSVSIYMTTVQPPGVPSANWLPIWSRRFNVMLRIYGTEPGVETYVPPGIQSR